MNQSFLVVCSVVVVALVVANYMLHSKLESIEQLLVEVRVELERSHSSGSSS